jgi:hypothetical protein
MTPILFDYSIGKSALKIPENDGHFKKNLTFGEFLFYKLKHHQATNKL